MKIVVKVLLIFCALIFNGCATKTVIQPCKVEIPARLYNSSPCAGEYAEIAKCILVKKEALLSDYNNLLTVVEACK